MITTEVVVSSLPSNPTNLYIGYSGGIDSHVLLHLSSLIPELRTKIIAVYVHHGLQLDADQWEAHCETVALELGLKFQCLRVNAEKIKGKSQEEIARDARYAAFKPLLGQDDVLLVAQHREDQMETVLLQLFRGAGERGLSGMPQSAPFGSGFICRPFLETSKQSIIDYAEKNKLCWIEDPSNKVNDFDRNFLRNQIIPDLKKRWPALDKTVARSARHCANSYKISQHLAKLLLENIQDNSDQTLAISKIIELDLNKQNLLIRQWLTDKQLRMPSEKMLDRIINEVVLAKSGKNPEVANKNYSIRRYRNKLFCLKPALKNQLLTEKIWPEGLDELELGDGQALKIVESSTGIPIKIWQKSKVLISYRKGAEKISLPGRAGHHSLKKLFQEKSIPPWERQNIPLIYLNGKLAAIAGLWISADCFCDRVEEKCIVFNLLEPTLYGL